MRTSTRATSLRDAAHDADTKDGAVSETGSVAHSLVAVFDTHLTLPTKRVVGNWVVQGRRKNNKNS